MSLDIRAPAARGYGRDRATPERQMQAMADRLRQVPAAWPEPEAAATEYRTLCVIGGNAAIIGGSIEGITYLETLATLTQEYDPNTDTVYPAGLGYGFLFINGVRQAGNVLIRHNFYGNQWAVLGSALLRVCGTETVTYDPGGGAPIISMTAYTFDWL
jgi:hypothetical protein